MSHIRELDSLRGVASLMVFFHHVCASSMQVPGWGAAVVFLRSLWEPGAYGVDVFFVLSGFLITSLLIDARGRPAYYQDFYWKRALRILPLYLLCLCGVLVFIPGSMNYVLLCALFISNFAPLFHLTRIGLFWTLAIEEQFYIVWPTVVRRRSTQELSRWALSIGFGVLVLRLIAAAFGHFNYDFTFFRCDGLAFGAFLACWYAQRDLVDAALENRTMIACFVAGAALIGLSFTPGATLRFVAFHAASAKTGTTLLSVAVVAVLIAYAGAPFLSLFQSRWLTFFGLISYAMYMIHPFVMYMYDDLRGAMRPGDNVAYLVRFGVIAGVTGLLCLLSRYLVELPAISLRRFVLKKPARGLQASHPFRWAISRVCKTIYTSGDVLDLNVAPFLLKILGNQAAVGVVWLFFTAQETGMVQQVGWDGVFNLACLEKLVELRFVEVPIAFQLLVGVKHLFCGG